MKIFLLTLYLAVIQNPHKNPDCILPIQKQQDPTFDGGWVNFHVFFGKHFRYPEKLLRSGVSGKTFVRFLVTTKGQVDSIQVVRSPGLGMDEEVIRVLKLTSGKWKPGKINGKTTAMFYTLPLSLDPE